MRMVVMYLHMFTSQTYNRLNKFYIQTKNTGLKPEHLLEILHESLSISVYYES